MLCYDYDSLIHDAEGTNSNGLIDKCSLQPGTFANDLLPPLNVHALQCYTSAVVVRLTLRVGTNVIGYRGWFTVVGAARRGKQQQRVITHAGIPSAPTVDRHVPTSQFKVHLTRDGRVWLMKPFVLILPLSQLSLELPCRYPYLCGEFCMTVFHCSGFIARILNPRQHVGCYNSLAPCWRLHVTKTYRRWVVGFISS